MQTYSTLATTRPSKKRRERSKTYPAEVAELADAHDSKSCSFGSVGSIPTFGTWKQLRSTYDDLDWHSNYASLTVEFLPHSPVGRVLEFQIGAGSQFLNPIIRCLFCPMKAVLHKLALMRSEERRVGKECRSRWSPY